MAGKIVLLELRSETEHDATFNSSVFKTFHYEQNVSIFLISNAKKIEYTGGPCLSVVIKYSCSADDSKDEDFYDDNVNLQKASTSESSENNAVEHCANVISPIPKSGRSCRYGRTQGRRNNILNLCDGCSNDKYSIAAVLCYSDELKLPHFHCRSQNNSQYILTIPNGPTPFARRNIGINPASTWHLVVNEAMVKHIHRVAEARRQIGDDSNWHVTLTELDVFLLYACGKLNYSKHFVDDLWGKNWEPSVTENNVRQSFP